MAATAGCFRGTGSWVFALQAGTIAGALIVLGGQAEIVKADSDSGKALALDQIEKKVEQKKVMPKYASESSASSVEPRCPLREQMRKEGLVLIDGNWYKVDKFVPYHPGGDEVLEQYLGADISFVFRVMHRQSDDILRRRKAHRAATPTELSILSSRRAEICRAMMSEASSSSASQRKTPSPEGGNGDDFDPNAFERDVTELHRSFVKAGYFAPTSSFVWQRVILAFSFLGASVALMSMPSTEDTNHSPSSSFVLASLLSTVAPGWLLGMFWHQCGYFMHDAEHHNLAGNERANDILGWLFGTVFLSVNGAWWREEHREHHALLNTYDDEGIKDPQMKEDVWVQNKKLLHFFGDEWVHLILYVQHVTFLPIILLFGRIGIMIDSTLTERKFRPWTILGNVLHVAFVYAVLRQSHNPLAVYSIAAIWQGVLSLQLVGNHYTKPWNRVHVATEGSFALWQILSTQDFVCPTWLRFAFGGLNFHYCHHTFPTMSREYFYVASPRIRALCEKHGVPNVQIGFLRCCWGMIMNFRDIAEEFSKQGHRGLAELYA